MAPPDEGDWAAWGLDDGERASERFRYIDSPWHTLYLTGGRVSGELGVLAAETAPRGEAQGEQPNPSR